MKEKPRFKWMEVSVTELTSFENIYFHFLWNVWLCAKSTKEWKRKREFVKISCLAIHWSFFSFELATLAFSDFSYKNKTKKTFNSIEGEDFVNFFGLLTKHVHYCPSFIWNWDLIKKEKNNIFILTKFSYFLIHV